MIHLSGLAGTCSYLRPVGRRRTPLVFVDREPGAPKRRRGGCRDDVRWAGRDATKPPSFRNGHRSIIAFMGDDTVDGTPATGGLAGGAARSGACPHDPRTMVGAPPTSPRSDGPRCGACSMHPIRRPARVPPRTPRCNHSGLLSVFASVCGRNEIGLIGFGDFPDGGGAQACRLR